jgi:hypothetical protein
MALCNTSGRFCRNLSMFFWIFSTIKTLDLQTILGISSKLQLVIVDVFFNYRGKWQAIADVYVGTSTQEVENILNILSHTRASIIAKTSYCCHIMPSCRRIMLA